MNSLLKIWNDWWSKRKELNKVRIEEDHKHKLKFIKESTQVKYDKKLDALKNNTNTNMLSGFTKALDALVPPQQQSNSKIVEKENKLNKTLEL